MQQGYVDVPRLPKVDDEVTLRYYLKSGDNRRVTPSRVFALPPALFYRPRQTRRMVDAGSRRRGGFCCPR